MALKARSLSVAMDTTPLSPAQTARLLAAECYRLKSERAFLNDEYCILTKLQNAEERVYEAARSGELYCSTARSKELDKDIRCCQDKKSEVADQLRNLGEEKYGALPQASLSLLGTAYQYERVHITYALEAQDFKDGAVLIKQGDPHDAFFIIVQGQVRCTPRRDHQCEVGPIRAALLEHLPRPRLTAPARQRLSTRAPRCSARQGCASRRDT